MKTLMHSFAAAAVLTLGWVNVQAQNGAAERTNAYMMLESYNLSRDAKELEKAKKSIDNAVNDAKTAAEPKTWKYMGSIYNKISFDATLRTQYPDAAVQAYKAFMKGLDLDVQKLKEKGKPESKVPAKAEYTEGLAETAAALYNAGADAFGAEKYADAYTDFSSILEIRPKTAFLTGGKPIEFKFTETDVIRLAGVSAIKANKLDEAEKLLMPHLEKGTFDDEMGASIYGTLANGLYNAGQKDKAKTVLASGRKKYANNQNLLISEINFALAEGRLSELEAQLKQAADANPDNVEILFVVGNMYDEIFRKKLETADVAAAQEFFTKAIEWYKKAVAKDPKHYNSAYSIGAIHVNFSNAYAEKMNALTNTKSQEYKDLDARYKALLDDALKALQEAEKINAKEMSVLVALKEVYARKDDETNFMKYKKLIEEAQKGN